MKKKILIISYEFPPLVGGAGTYSRELAVGLSRNNYQVTVVTCYHGNAAEYNLIDKVLLEEEGVLVYRFRTFGKFFFLQMPFFLRKRLGKKFQNEFEHIILSDSRSTRYAILHFNDRQLAKSTHVFHGGEIYSFYLQPNLQVRLSGIHRRFVSSLLKSQAAIAVSQDLCDIFVNEIPELKNKIHTVLHGIDDKIFKPLSVNERADTRKKMGIEKDEFVILSASRLVKEKGQDKLIESFYGIAKKYQNVNLLIAGDGKYKSELEQQVKHLRLEKRVRFLGALSRSYLAKTMAVCDVFALLSRAQEGFGLVYIEANACRVPVLAGNVAGVFDAVEDRISGLLVDPNRVEDIRAKIEILLQSDLRQGLSESAYKRFKNGFTNTMMADRTLTIINK